MTSIIDECREYWTGRASGYSEVNQEELATPQHCKWRDCLSREIREHFPNREVSDIRVLEVGTGPGFFAILLCELGYDVTAVDLTPAMLKEAKKNAGPLAERIRFLEMNAEELSFEDESFDVILSRNLTWNLPHPCKAYVEWSRVLKKDGIIINFDANWYAYLYDEEAQAAYERDRFNSAEAGIEDRNVGDNFDVMEDIARRIPLSGLRRPAWDRKVLIRHGLLASVNEKIWEEVWSEEEKINFASTPMFMVKAVKGDRGQTPVSL